jgi:hypothetical protein
MRPRFYLVRRLMLGTIVTKLLQRMHAELKRPLTIIETGTIRDVECLDVEREERSTLCIARVLRDGDGFHSIDISEQHIAISKAVIEKAGFGGRVEYHCGPSHQELLGRNWKIDFALLDSDSNAEVIGLEFELVAPLMKQDGIVVIDDAFKPFAVNKARLVAPAVESFDLMHQAIGIPFGPVARRILAEFR